MYLRITKRRNGDGSEVRYYQLAENIWDPARGHAIAKVIYNFGRADQLDQDELRRLAASILRVRPCRRWPRFTKKHGTDQTGSSAGKVVRERAMRA